MQNNRLKSPHLPPEFYPDDLLTIKDIRLTLRQIDIIACLISGGTGKTISSLLDIEIKTLEAHKKDIGGKIGGGIQEDIISFVQTSDKYALIKQHYLILLYKSEFEKQLKEHAKNSHGNFPVFKIETQQIYSNKPSFFNLLIGHLRLSGIIILSDDKRTEIDKSPSCTLSILTHPPIKQLQKNKKPEKTLFIILNKEINENILKKMFEDGFNYIVFRESKNYFSSYVKILKKVFPDTNLEKLTSMIDAEGSHIFKNYAHNSILSLSKEKSFTTLNIFQKQRKWIHRGGLICLISMSILSLTFSTNKTASLPEKVVQISQSIRSELPLPDEILLKRSELITQIEKKLKEQQGIQIVSLVGMGGAGKTTLARQYAHARKSSVVWEINSETKENLRNSFENLAYALAKTEEEKKTLRERQEIKDAKERGGKIHQFVMERLRVQSNWLLIFDNVEKFSEIKEYFPQDSLIWGNGRVIITTRDANIQIKQKNVIYVEELSDDKKLEFFSRTFYNKLPDKLTSDQSQQVIRFLEKIPPFPLDVSIAAHYLKATNTCFDSYLENLNQPNIEFEEVQTNLLKEGGLYSKTRYNIITTSLQQLINVHKNFEGLALFISLLDSQNIPRDLLEMYTGKTVVDSFIYHLKKYSLITKNLLCSTAKNSVFSLHRSTQAIILAYLVETLNLKKEDFNFQQVIDTLEKYIFDIVHKEDVLKMPFMLSHCERILRHNNLLTPSARALIKGELGTIYFYLNRYKDAEVLLQQAIGVLKENQKTPNKLGQFLSCLASIYISLGDGEKSIKYHTESIATFQKYFPNNYLKIALHLTYLGSVYRDIGMYEKSKNTLEKAHSIFRNKSLENHTAFARNLVDLGKVYRSLGDYEKARVLQEQGFSLYKKSLPKDHFRIAWAAIYLANTLNELEKYKEAQDLLEVALQIYKKNFSETHKRRAWLLATLGHTYEGLGQYKKAKALLEKSLESLSESYFEVVWVLARLGNICLKLEDFENAKGFFEKSLIILENNYNKDHVETARVLKSLGHVYLVTGHIETADNLINKAIRIFQNSNHPDLCFALEILAEMYIKKSTLKMKEERKNQSKNFKAQAIHNFEQALYLAKVYFLKDSPHIKRIQEKLKSLNSETKRFTFS